MRVLSVLHSKGGTGKSTLAIHLARALQMGVGVGAPQRVLLVDTDAGQLTAQTWASDLDERIGVLPVVATQKLAKDLPAFTRSFDWCVVDGAAKLERVDAEAIAAADIVLIPLQPSVADLWPVRPLVELIHTRRAVTGGRPAAAFVVSRATRIREAGELAEALEEDGLPLLGQQVSERVASRRALAAGRTVFEAPEGGETASEAKSRLAAADEYRGVLLQALALLP